MPLIAASIMSKKLAEGLTGLVLDVKQGSGAFMPDDEGELALARADDRARRRSRLPCVALFTAMDRPLGLPAETLSRCERRSRHSKARARAISWT